MSKPEQRALPFAPANREVADLFAQVLELGIKIGERLQSVDAQPPDQDAGPSGESIEVLRRAKAVIGGMEQEKYISSRRLADLLGLSPKKLARALRGFGIHPVTQRLQGRPMKVYRCAAFLDVETCYRRTSTGR